jgi:acyl-coenzyme A thioesterase PaaI-like protein
MSTDFGWVADTMQASVPWVNTAGVEFKEVSPERVIASLPDVETQRNHVGGPHAAVIFGLGETASGAIALAGFAATMDRATPLVARAEIDYRKLATGALTAEAVLSRPPAEVLAELDGGNRPEFAVRVTIRNAEGATTAEMNVVWTLRPNRAG